MTRFGTRRSRKTVRRRKRGSSKKRKRGSKKKKKGSLKHNLGIREGERIPKTILRKIKDSKIGNVVKLPTKKGRDTIRVSTHLKRQVMAVWNSNYAGRNKEGSA